MYLASEKELLLFSILFGIFRSSCLTVCYKTYIWRREELKSLQILVVLGVQKSFMDFER